MIKTWMIILIVTGSSSFGSHQEFVTGSIYKTEEDCMEAVKATKLTNFDEKHLDAFCVETYSKLLEIK